MSEIITSPILISPALYYIPSLITLLKGLKSNCSRLGMYVSQSEGANFWLGVITDLKQRGVEDILIACIDNLKDYSLFKNGCANQCTVTLKL